MNGGGAMIDQIRRNMLTTGVAATAIAAAPGVFAQQAAQGASAFSFYEKGNVRIRYQEIGSGFPLLVTPGGGLNSRIKNWPAAVINAMEEFKTDFRCITMDQRNATDGESVGPVPVDGPWDAFADDQLELVDHLGIREFFCIGYRPRRRDTSLNLSDCLAYAGDCVVHEHHSVVLF